MAEEQSQANDSTKQILQQGYRTALFELRGSIEDYISGNEAARPTILADIKRHLLDADKGSVQKLFTGANALKGAADESFSLSGADTPEEIRGLSIPKRIFTEDFKAKTFFPEYDRINTEKLQLAAETEASVKAEGAATRLEQAVFGPGLGAVGAALGGMVGMAPARGRAPAKAPGAPTKEAEAPTAETREEKAKKRLAQVKARRAPKEVAEQLEEEEEEEKAEADKKLQAAEEAVQKVRKVEDSALYHKRFIDILSSLAVDPEPYAGNGAAYTGIADLKHQVKEADKTSPQPELKELIKRLDELGTEYRAGQLEQGRGEDGRPRLRSAIMAVRDKLGTAGPVPKATLRGVAPPPAIPPPLPARLATLRGVAPAPTEPSARKTIRGVAPPAAATPSAPETKDKDLNALLSKSDSLVKQADDIRRALDQAPDDEKLLQQKTAVAAEISKLSGQIQDHAAKNEPGNKNLIQLGGALALAATWKDQGQVAEAVKAYGQNRQAVGFNDEARVARTFGQADDLLYRLNDFRSRAGQGKMDDKERLALAAELETATAALAQDMRLYAPDDPRLASLQKNLTAIKPALTAERFDHGKLSEAITKYGHERNEIGPAVGYGHLVGRANDLVSQAAALNTQIKPGEETGETKAQRQRLAAEVDGLYEEIKRHNTLFDPRNKELLATRQVLTDMRRPLERERFSADNQERLAQALKSYAEVPHLMLPAAVLGLGGAAMAAPVAAQAPGGTEISTQIEVEATGRQKISMEAPVIPPPQPALARAAAPRTAEIQVTGRLPVPVSIPLPPPPTQAPAAGIRAPTAAITGVGLMAAAAQAAPAEAGTLMAPGGVPPGPEIPVQAVVSRPQAGKTIKVALPPPPTPTRKGVVTEARPAATRAALPREKAPNAPQAPAAPATAPSVPGPQVPAPPPAAAPIAAPPPVTRHPLPVTQPPPGKAPSAKRPRRPQTGIPGMGTFATAGGAAARPAKGYRSIGPQEISRATALDMHQGRARREAQGQEEYWENLPEEGIDLSEGGFESALGEGQPLYPVLPGYDQTFDAMEDSSSAYYQEQEYGPGSMVGEEEMEEGGEAQAKEAQGGGAMEGKKEAEGEGKVEGGKEARVRGKAKGDKETKGGGLMESDLERKQKFHPHEDIFKRPAGTAPCIDCGKSVPLAQRQRYRCPECFQKYLNSLDEGRRKFAEMQGARDKAWWDKRMQEKKDWGSPYGPPGKKGETSTALKLLSSQIQKKMQQDERLKQIQAFKEKIESLGRAKQTFKNLIDLGEILASESGVTILTLWLEWNVDLINKRVANGSLPWFEKKPPESATSLEKTLSSVKDGVTILADILVPLSAVIALLVSILIPAILITTMLTDLGEIVDAVINYASAK